jgi:hypothetical protein
MDPSTAAIPRHTAVRRIADHLADRDSFVITLGPATIPAVRTTLDQIPTWTLYLDSGLADVTRTNQLEQLLRAELFPTAGVLTVPKTVPAHILRAVVGQALPDDGSQDVVILQNPDGTVDWPALFVDAVELVNPAIAAGLRTHEPAHLS